MTKKEAQLKKEVPTSVKGMRDFIGKEFLAYQGFYEKAAEVATYYGFTPIEPPMVENEEVFVRTSGESSDVVEKELYSFKTKGGDRLALRPEFTASVMRAYIEHGMLSWPQPVMLYSFGPVFRHDKPQRGRYRDPRQFNLEVMGSEKSIADAITIHTTVTILKEVGLENFELRINSVGDKECRTVYRRELINYYKKHASKICADCDRRLKTNPLRLLDCKNPTCQPIKAGAPQPVSFLCEPCKRHFKEVLEFLESLGITYTIDPTLVRGLDYYTRTAFEVFHIPEAKEIPTSPEEGKGVPVEEVAQPIAITGGGRYDYLAKDLGSNKPVPGVGVAIGVDRVLSLVNTDDLAPRIIKKPKVFFIQLGFEAKLKSLSVVEILRKAKVPIYHSLSKDSLGSQLATAEKLGIPTAILMGQKEVIEESVIVRDMETRSQQTVKIDKLADYIKKIK